MSVQQVIHGTRYPSGEKHGFEQSHLKIEPESEIIFEGTSEILQATLILKNEDSTKKVGVKLKTNLPVNSISVKPKIVLIEPLQQVRIFSLKDAAFKNCDVRFFTIYLFYVLG